MPFKYNPYSGTLDYVIDPGGGTAVTTVDTDSGSATPNGSGTITLAGGTGISTSGAANTVTIDLNSPVSVSDGGTGLSTLTDGAILIGDGTNAVELIGPLSDGQLLIGDTGGVSPVASTITGGTGITITNGPGSITIDASGDVANSYHADTGSASPSLNVLNILGGTGLDTSASGNTVTVSGEDASASNKGIASFDANDFSVTSGDVTFNEIVRLKPGMTENLQIYYSSPTITIKGANGNDLSSTNPGYVVIRDSSGNLKVHEITSNFTFQDASGTGEVTGNEFGVNLDAISTNDVPFFLYFGVDDNDENPVPFISRFPTKTILPATTAIGTPSSAIADSDGDVWCFDSITVANYDGNPCDLVGSFRMSQTGTFDWTCTSITEQDGFGEYQEGISFTWLPVFQGDGTAGSFTYSSRSGFYSFLKNGYVVYGGDATTNGSSGSPTGFMTAIAPFYFKAFPQYGPFWCASTTAVPANTNQITTQGVGGGNLLYFRTVVFGSSNSYLAVDASGIYHFQIIINPDSQES